MKIIKQEKGITLVALIITIIVLLILAVVAISAVQGDGIVNHAKNAKSAYQATQTNEKVILENHMDLLNNYNNSETTSTLIQFTINGITCYAEENGTRWNDWINSTYNTIGVYVDENFYCVALDGKEVHIEGSYEAIDPASTAVTINDGDVFILSGNLPTDF